jgi:hypothetical protein
MIVLSKCAAPRLEGVNFGVFDSMRRWEHCHPKEARP